MAFQVRTPVSRRAVMGASPNSAAEKQGNQTGNKKERSYWNSRQKLVKTYKEKGYKNRAFSLSPRRIRKKREANEWEKSKSRLQPQGEIVSILRRILVSYLCIYDTRRVNCSVFLQASQWKIELCSSELLYKMAVKFPIECALSPSFSFFLTKFELLELALWGVFHVAFALGTSTLPCILRASHSCYIPSSTDGAQTSTASLGFVNILEKCSSSLFCQKKIKI